MVSERKCGLLLEKVRDFPKVALRVFEVSHSLTPWEGCRWLDEMHSFRPQFFVFPVSIINEDREVCARKPILSSSDLGLRGYFGGGFG
ncbi:MAG: hypothetical protein AUF79_18485 [Crenarchaeota archaeon 13_1_20CM_2_51_8]|nr:MAG: hypothetical protein AUF79_18485 [Crenarchaeota archaeon 13_1_20CM_2_51_8]